MKLTMFGRMKSFFKWNLVKNIENKQSSSSLLLIISINILEDVLLWRKMWLSLLFFLFFNIGFMVCLFRQLNLLQFVIGLSIMLISIDAFETWLKYNHRTTCLKRLASNDSQKMKASIINIKDWMKKQWISLIYLRHRNHTKAFLLLQIIFSLIFIIGRCTSGYAIIYLLFTILFLLHKFIPLLIKAHKKIQQNAESDFELEGLIPDESEINLDLLSIEPEQKPIADDRQSLDYWKPEDLPLEEASDSSDNSSSLVRNLSIEKMQTLSKDVEVTDSSEDEYIPEEPPQCEQYQSSLEVQPVSTWSNAAFNVFSNFRGAVVNMVYSSKDEKKRQRVSSVDSSDGFEIIDKNEF